MGILGKLAARDARPHHSGTYDIAYLFGRMRIAGI